MTTGIDKRVQINKIIESQLPEFVRADFENATEFFKQYYISQEFQGGPSDLIDNLDQYLKTDNLKPEVVYGKTTLTSDVSTSSTSLSVTSTKGYPDEYGLLKIGNEIISYTSKTSTEFVGLIRGFSGVTGYNVGIATVVQHVNRQSLTFENTSAESHSSGASVTNLSVLFIQEFYKKLKKTFLPGLENNDFTKDLDVGNFIKHARSFYQSKGIQESIRILMKVLFGEAAVILDLEERLIKPSSADFLRREVIVVEPISGDPQELVGQTLTKSNDPNTNASVSEVEIFTRSGIDTSGPKSYFKISLFVGYNDRDLIEGTFTIPGMTRVQEPVSIGGSIITVDSTIGFDQSGSVIINDQTITYGSKSINQFFDCSGVNYDIPIRSDVRSNEVLIGYENGDPNKKVELRITGVLSEFETTSDITLISEGERIYVKNVGERIENPENDPTYKEIFANSWIYNTSSRYQIEEINGSTFLLSSNIDKSSLKVGDTIDVIGRNNDNVSVGATNLTVSTIDKTRNEITVNGLGISLVTGVGNSFYDLRRNLKKANSTSIEIKEGNDALLTDTLNLYNETNKNAYVASNSLPSYEGGLPSELKIQKTISSDIVNELEGYNAQTFDYNTIIDGTSKDIPLVSGDQVVYNSNGSPLTGLSDEESFFIEVINKNPGKIKLYRSRGLVGAVGQEVRFKAEGAAINATHEFTKKSQFGKKLTANKILRKFPLEQKLYVSGTNETVTNQVGMLVDGVEITTPISGDAIYFGPLSSIDVFNSGEEYDVINPPNIKIQSSDGVDATAEAIVNGSVQQVLVDPHDFDIDKVKSIALIGGNGSGCVLQPNVGTRFRELEFDSRDIFFSGGISKDDETITFTEEHFFENGQLVYYSSNGNSPIGTGPFKSNSNESTGTLATGAPYHVRVVNSKTVTLYNSREDAIVGVNTIGISTATNAAGIHKFRTEPKNVLQSVKVIEPGSGYSNRKIKVLPINISTAYDSLTSKNHGFKNGDLVEYKIESNGTAVSGLDVTHEYYVIKIDDDTFRVADAGVSGTRSNVDFIRNDYVELSSQGVGKQIFKYPDIKVEVVVSFASTITGTINVTPIVKGGIEEVRIVEPGTKYGSTILNHSKTPDIKIENGSGGIVRPVIVDGKIIDAQILNRGRDYHSDPDIVITTTGISGSGAILRAVVDDTYKIADVIVVNSGIGYTSTGVEVDVVPRGKNAILNPRVRKLTVDSRFKDGDYELGSIDGGLAMRSLGYSPTIQNQFNEDETKHSPIIGWAYDGNPIYGPFAYTDPGQLGPNVGIITSGYKLNTANVFDRPSEQLFKPGYFIDDWNFDGSGDLDIHNGRFCKTNEFPNGIYAYFATVEEDSQSSQLVPAFPYYIGKTFKSPFISENSSLNQEFDFNNSKLIRNTLPYKVGDKFSDNDFIIESNEDLRQISSVESITTGEVDSLQILDGGSNYKIGDVTKFDNDLTNGVGLSAEVESLVGFAVTALDTTLERYESSIFTWVDANTVKATTSPFFDLLDESGVNISGLSSSIIGLQDTFTVGIKTDVIGLAKSMTENVIVSGRIDDIYVDKIPKSVSVGSSIKINDDEIVSVLNIYPIGSILRVKRFAVGVAHTYGSKLDVLPTTLSIPVKTKKFDSNLNDKIFFNAHQSVGVGTTAGASISTEYVVGETKKNQSIPTRQIYLPNHPFHHGQKLTFTKKGTAASLLVGNESLANNLFNLPDVTTDTSTVFVINKGPDYIGIQTAGGIQAGVGTLSEGLFFHGNGSDDFEYFFETNKNQVTGNIDSITTKVSLDVVGTGSTIHGLENGDIVSLNVIPNTVVGLGSTGALALSFDETSQKLLVNKKTFATSDIDTTKSEITIQDHEYKTGDRVLYAGDAAGLTNRAYFVYKVNSNTFQLGETLKDVTLDPANIINITSQGSADHSVSLINPYLKAFKNATLLFDVSDSSLEGYKLKFYYDKDFRNEFITSQDSDLYNVTGVSTAGIGSEGRVSVRYSSSTPSKLFYSVEKSGYISTADTLVKNNSEIQFVDSVYNGDYKVFGISSDTFNISTRSLPELLSYKDDQCDIIEYSTKSRNVTGSIKDLKIISKGQNYKEIPKFEKIISENGVNANIVALSTSIGRIDRVRIIDIGYEYSSDKTLSPEAFVSPIIRIDNVDSIKEINIVSGGKEYLSPPDLVLFDPQKNEIVDDSSLVAFAPNQAISSVDILGPINGLNSINHRVVALNNSNGVGIGSMLGGASGIVTCVLETPLNGFSNQPFKVGDEIFVEGVELFGEAGIGTQQASTSGINTEAFDGDGYNSENYDFRFFKVVEYTPSNPAVLKYSIAGLTTNPGIAKTFQSGYATIVNKNNYPEFEVVQQRGRFLENEQLYVQRPSGLFALEDAVVTGSREEFIKIDGLFEFNVGDRIRGANSDVSATITDIAVNKAKFVVDYASRQDIGWSDNIGKLSEDFQVVPDNDYYQNLSYSIKSQIPWDDLVNPVNRLVHPAGLKNFADVGINSASQAGIKTAIQSSPVVVLDVMGDKRVDTIHTFDFASDYDARPDVNPTKSKFATLENTKLTDFTLCKSNRVLIHDDISGSFSSKGFQDEFAEIEEIERNFAKYTIQVIDPDTQNVQLSEHIVLTTTNDAILIDKSSEFSVLELGEFEAVSDSFARKALNFIPTEKYNRDHDIKVLKTDFKTNAFVNGSKSIGNIDLYGANVLIDSQDAVTGDATTVTILEFPTNDFNGFVADVLIQDDITKTINFSEIIVDFDGTNVYISEKFADSTNNSFTSDRIGITTARFDSANNKVIFECTNETPRDIIINTSITGLGNTSVGVGTHRFAVPGQPVGAEQSGRLESTNFKSLNGDKVLITRIDNRRDSSVKSIVRVSTPTESAIHQATILQTEGTSYTIPYSFTGNSNSGIGTIGSETNGNFTEVYLYPDPNQTSEIEIQAYNTVFNIIPDFFNTPDPLDIGPAEARLFLSAYDGINGSRANKVNFPLRHEGQPIYNKFWNPNDTNQVKYETGEITIPNHFFNDNEELVYTPGSSFVGVGSTAVSIGSTTNVAGIVTDILPETVFVKVFNENKFFLYSRPEYISSGIAITFTGVGEGNAHKFSMTKKLSKTVIGLDGIVQQPITFTSIEHTLRDAIGIGVSQFVLSGISSVQPRDVLKVGTSSIHEYMKVEQVGFSSLPEGTINDSKDVALGIATLPVVRVRRGSLGIAATTFSAGAAARVHRGSFNIVDSEVIFLDPPKGNTRARRDDSNLPYVKAEFSGRTFLRSDYTTNMLFDDISDSFTGIGRTYTLTVGGANTETGVGIGNGIVFINGVFQTPLTLNNAGNNYELLSTPGSGGSVGVSSISFTGISSENGVPLQSEFDINQNQIPRGGIIVSLGSKPGLGYAPLVGASVKPKLKDNTNLFAAGSITNIVGVGTSSKYSLGIQTAAYDNTTGIITVTTNEVHGYALGYPNTVHLKDLYFRCPTDVVGTPTNATYDPSTGDLVLTINNHGLTNGDAIKLDEESITFSCTYGGGGNRAYPRSTDPAFDKYLYISDVTTNTFKVNVLLGTTPTNTDPHTFVSATADSVKTIGGGGYVGYTTSYFQDHERALPVIGIVSERTFEVKAGVSTIPHFYHSGGYAYEFYNDLTFGSGYRDAIGVGVTDIEFVHKFVSANSNAVTANTGADLTPSTADYISSTGELILTVGDQHNMTAASKHTVTNATYDAATGVSVITINNHGFSNGDYIKVKDYGISYTCTMDSNTSIHPYPRPSDPISGKWIQVSNVSTNTFEINVGTSPAVAFTPTNAIYDPKTGLMELTIGAHTLRPGTSIKLDQESIKFTCDVDDNTSVKGYPRASDPFNDTAIKIESVTDTTITIKVLSTTPSTNTTRHTFYSADANAVRTGGNYAHTFSSAITDGILHAQNTLTIATNSLTFTCDRDDHDSNHPYPRSTDPAAGATLGIEETSANTITVNVGTGGGGGTGAILDTQVAFNKHRFVSSTNNSIAITGGGNLTPTDATYDPSTGELVVTAASHGVGSATTVTPTAATYVKNTGNLTLTVANHGFQIGDKILIEDNSLIFTCTKDGNQTEHSYPRSSDYASGIWLTIANVTTNTFRVNVNPTPTSEQYTHTFVGVKYNGSVLKSNAEVTITGGSLVFTCAQDAYSTLHPYPRTTDPAYNTGLPVGKTTLNTLRLQVGKSPSGTGGALEFTLKDFGARFVNPEITTPEPNYDAVDVKGISRLGIGKTTDTGANLLLNLDVTPNPSNVSIGRSFFEISKFQIAREGHSFAIGDKFTPVGLVTDKRLQKPFNEFELEVVNTFNDFFSAWQFGELDFIDSISSLQTGFRKRFPLFRNGQLLSFEVDELSALGESIDLNAVLVIFVNGVLQTPNIAYQFQGGTTFKFTEPPDIKDKVDIFFYKGEDGVDVEIVNVNETIKSGDEIRIRRNSEDTTTEDQLSNRIIKSILGSDLVETTTYRGPGINEIASKPVDWIKQKEDKIINGELISKAREVIEPQIYPTAKVIGDINETTGIDLTGGIFVDDATSFFYEDLVNPSIEASDRYNVNITAVDMILFDHTDFEAAEITTNVNNTGQVDSYTIVNPGAGYTTTPVTLSISAPIGVGIGTTVKDKYAVVGVSTFAEAKANIVDGKVDSITIDNVGFGYTNTNPPSVTIPQVTPKYEKLLSYDNVEGYTGIITGITQVEGSQGPGSLALRFFYTSFDSNANKLQVGYPVLIKDTSYSVGSGLTSVDGTDDQIVSIGSTFLDNIYKVSAFSQLTDFRAHITCDILSTTSEAVGIATTGSYDPTDASTTMSLGTLSWGRIYNGERSSNPISIGVTGLTVDAGLSTFPTIQRRYFNGVNSELGLRNTGAIRVVTGL